MSLKWNPTTVNFNASGNTLNTASNAFTRSADVFQNIQSTLNEQAQRTIENDLALQKQALAENSLAEQARVNTANIQNAEEQLELSKQAYALNDLRFKAQEQVATGISLGKDFFENNVQYDDKGMITNEDTLIKGLSGIANTQGLDTQDVFSAFDLARNNQSELAENIRANELGYARLKGSGSGNRYSGSNGTFNGVPLNTLQGRAEIQQKLSEQIDNPKAVTGITNVIENYAPEAVAGGLLANMSVDDVVNLFTSKGTDSGAGELKFDTKLDNYYQDMPPYNPDAPYEYSPIVNELLLDRQTRGQPLNRKQQLYLLHQHGVDGNNYSTAQILDTMNVILKDVADPSQLREITSLPTAVLRVYDKEHGTNLAKQSTKNLTPSDTSFTSPTTPSFILPNSSYTPFS